jgi:hypothetical protein
MVGFPGKEEFMYTSPSFIIGCGRNFKQMVKDEKSAPGMLLGGSVF